MDGCFLELFIPCGLLIFLHNVNLAEFGDTDKEC